MRLAFAACALLLMTAALLSGCSGEKEKEGVKGTEVFQNFESSSLGKPSTQWEAYNGDWSVVENATAPNGPKVMQGSGGSSARSALLSEAAGDFEDSTINVRFNILTGDAPNGGGLVFNYDESGNYVIIRASPAEQGWHLFVVHGDDSAKKDAATVEGAGSPPTMNLWVHLKVTVKDKHVQAYDGTTKVIDYTLSGNDPTEGRVGLFVRGNSVVQFDGFEVDPA